LVRYITIQRRSVTQSSSGEEVATWGTVVQRRLASVSPTRGDERFSQPQYAAKQTTEFRIRYSNDVADLTPLDRIVYPAIGEGEEAPATSIYDVLAVHELGRRETLQVVAFRRADIGQP
jgi:head-tail adaptor